jgi:hypothetical protein
MRNLPRPRLLWHRIVFRLLTIILLIPALLFSFGSLLSLTARARPLTPHLPAANGVVVNQAVKHDVSPLLSSIKPVHHAARGQDMETAPFLIAQGAPNGLHDQVQDTRILPNTPLPSHNFDGVGNGFTGPQGTFTVKVAPPDTNGAVGPQDFVQIVNTDFAVFNKDPSRGTVGSVRFGPVQINMLWSGFGGNCQADNDGDPIVMYDSIADRWLITQFAITNPNPNFLQCIAVSTGSDPTGSYNRYSFAYTNFPDYAKFGLWPDAYYGTFNMFNATLTSFLGVQVCAFDRASMLTGANATQQCFMTSSSFSSLLPSTLDGTDPPPVGSPNYLLALTTTTSLGLWKFHVDFVTAANSTFTGPTSIAIASYSQACGGGACIPQFGTSNQLDSLGDRLMYRLEYRNFGTYESLVVDHSVTAGSSVGMRWYEIRNPGGNPNVFQSGTYAPDASFRWMGSISQDQSADMIMGFSISSSSLHPGISYTGRLAGDALGTMGQGEISLIVGAGSQTNGLARWGDYSSMVVDQSDGCTFWYTNEYIPANGSFNWKTRIGSFKFPACSNTVPNDFSISANPASLSIAQGSNGTSTISTAVTSGSAGTVSLTASVSPPGPTTVFNPTSVTAGNSSTLTVSVGSSVPAGTYTVTVSGTEGPITHSTSVTVTVAGIGVGTSITNGGFETGNFTGWNTGGTTSISMIAHSGSFSAEAGSSAPTPGDSFVRQTFTAATGTSTLRFWYLVNCPDTVQFDWATATLQDNTTGTTRTILSRTCNAVIVWVQVTASVIAGHSYTLTLISHDDNSSANPTFTLFDDVAVN